MGTMASQIPFQEATDIRDLVARQHRIRRHMVMSRVITVVLACAALVAGATPFVLQALSARSLASRGAVVRNTVKNWPYPRAQEELEAAHAYNRKLAASGQPILGEVGDPFASDAGSSHVAADPGNAGTEGVSETQAVSGTKDAASLAARDREYMGLLRAQDSVMGSIIIPKISVNLPIYHGTSEQALANGAGHLYGTSLPVGGASTHAVITGHRGMVSAAMFTRLDEMRKGDFFYIDVMGEELGYQVDSIRVIDPSDVSHLRIVPGQDRVTLMTCTPYGINTQRLLVSGHRVAIPQQAPEPSRIADAMALAIAAGLVTLVLGLLVLHRRRRVLRRVKHARQW
ncbi:class C sortase [Bifidobacterium magnum]